MDRPASRLASYSNKQAFLKEKLLFPRGVLVLLRETGLFNSLIDKAIEDMDSVLEELILNEK